ncbi:MAG: GNAT family N-acetyltransferase [Capsulimonadaceae bacterium]
MPIDIRLCIESDHPELAKLSGAVGCETNGCGRYWRPARQYDEGRPAAVALTATIDDVVAAYAAIRSVRQDRARMDLMVHPDYRGQGVGASLYDRLLSTDTARTSNLQARVNGTNSPDTTIGFLRRRGFEETERVHGLILHKDDFEPMRFVALIDRLEIEGISITTLAKARRHDPDYAEKLQVLESAMEPSWPDADPEHAPFTPVDYDDFAIAVLDEIRRYEDAFFLAIHGNRYMGRSSALDGITAVHPDFRHRGIGTALLAKSTEYLFHIGRHEHFLLATHRGLAAIAQRLGYKICGTELRLVRMAGDAGFGR